MSARNGHTLWSRKLPSRAESSPLLDHGRLYFGTEDGTVYALKASDGSVRWTYKVLVVPGAPLVASGPYRWVRHPNYVGVLGELIGVAVLLGAWITGPLVVIFFSWLLRRRVQAEERALGIGIY